MFLALPNRFQAYKDNLIDVMILLMGEYNGAFQNYGYLYTIRPTAHLKHLPKLTFFIRTLQEPPLKGKDAFYSRLQSWYEAEYDNSNHDMTVSEFLYHLLRGYGLKDYMRHGTARLRCEDVVNKLERHVGDIPLNRVTSAQIESIVRDIWSEQPLDPMDWLSHETAMKYQLMLLFFRAACALGFISENPCSLKTISNGQREVPLLHSLL